MPQIATGRKHLLTAITTMHQNAHMQIRLSPDDEKWLKELAKEKKRSHPRQLEAILDHYRKLTNGSKAHMDDELIRKLLK